MFTNLKNVSAEFPKTFWVLTFSTFIDRLGGYLLFPFFAIYVRTQLGATMTQVGFLFMMMALGSLIGSFFGGAMADKIGRKKVILFGLVVSGCGNVILGLVQSLEWFYVLAAVLGLLGDVGGPARQAMIPDLLPKEKQTQGYGILRVGNNIAATIGPTLGGFLATQSYMVLFVSDAVASFITAILVFAVIPETKPQHEENAAETPTKSFGTTLKEYKFVLKDKTFMIYISISVIMILVYMQMYNTLNVYLQEFHGFTTQMIGFLMSMNALLVVLTQFWITRKLAKIPPLQLMALGTFLYGIGFGMIGFAKLAGLFYIAMFIITVGEMVALPTSQGVVANLAPPDKRGRYMAIFGFSWAIPNLFGVMLAGLIMDNANDPNWVWYGAIVLSAFAMTGFLLLHKTSEARFREEIINKSEAESDCLIEGNVDYEELTNTDLTAEIEFPA